MVKVRVWLGADEGEREGNLVAFHEVDKCFAALRLGCCKRSIALAVPFAFDLGLVLAYVCVREPRRRCYAV